MLAPAAGRHQRAIGTVLHHDLADAEGLQSLDGRFRARIAPQHRLVVVGRQRDVDPLEGFHEHRARARQVAAPAARPEVAVEGDLHTLLPDHLEEREETPQSVVGIERERDAGEIDELRLRQPLGDAGPVRQFEQLARRRSVAPVVAAERAGGTTVDQSEPGQPATHPEHEVAGNAFGGGKREDRVGIRIIAERGGEGSVDAGARQVDGDIETVAGTTEPEPSVAAAHELDRGFAHRDHSGSRLVHDAALG